MHKAWVSTQLKKGGSVRLVRCVLGGAGAGGRPLLLYPHGLLRKQLAVPVRR